MTYETPPSVSATTDHFKKYNLPFIPRPHILVRYENQPRISALVQAYSTEVLDRLPKGLIYAKIDPEDAHTTVIEATPAVQSYPPYEKIQDVVQEFYGTDDMPERVCDYVEAETAEEMREYNYALQRRLKNWEPFDIPVGEECILGSDGVLLSVGSQERFAQLRREAMDVLELPIVEGHEPWKHLTLAYSYECLETSRARKIIREQSALIPPAPAHIIGIYSVLQYSNGETYKAARRKLLRFGEID